MPVVALRIRVAASVPAGQDIEYRICVENKAKAPAYHVMVRNPLPKNARFVRATPEPTSHESDIVWQLGTLDACACKEITLVLAPTGSGDVKNCARVLFEHGECVTTRIERPTLTLRKLGPAQGLRYDVLTYKLEVTNSGSTPIKDVVLNDTLPEGLQHKDGKLQLTWELGTLEAGQCLCKEYQVVAMVSGRLTNRAEVRAADIHEQAESSVTITEPLLQLKKTGPEQCRANQSACYRITVSNPGTAPVTNLVLTDPVPEKTTFVSASQGGQLIGNQVKWNIGTLAAGSEQTVELVLRCQGSGKVCNRVTAAADRGLTAQSEVCTEFLGVSALLLQVDPVPVIEVDGEGKYRIRVSNTGSDPATGVQVTAVLPPQMTLVAAKGQPQHRQDGQRVIYEPISLAAKADLIYEVNVRARQAAEVPFQVELRSEQMKAEDPPVLSVQRTTIHDEYRTPSTQLQPPPGSQPAGAPPTGSQPAGTPPPRP